MKVYNTNIFLKTTLAITLAITAHSTMAITCVTADGYYLDTNIASPSYNTCIIDEIQPDMANAGVPDENAKATLTVGLNPLSDNFEPLYDPVTQKYSDWTLKVMKAGEVCDQSTNETFPSDRFVTSNVDYYINKDNSCAVPDGFDYTLEDPRALPHILTWNDLGLVPDPDGRTETFKCKFEEDCPGITSNKTELSQSLLSINPEPGLSPILSGKTTALLYNYKTIDSSNKIGFPGLGGKADLPAMPVSTKYCYVKHDATTELTLTKSEFAQRPTLDFKKINWKPFVEGPSATDGAVGSKKNQSTSVIKGLDPSVLFWIGNDSVLSK